jgi:hypothetical protein
VIPLSPRIAALSDASRERLAATPRLTTPPATPTAQSPHPYAPGVQRTSAELAAHEAWEVTDAISSGITVSWNGDSREGYKQVARAEADGFCIRYFFTDGTAKLCDRRHAGCGYGLLFAPGGAP